MEETKKHKPKAPDKVARHKRGEEWGAGQAKGRCRPQWDVNITCLQKCDMLTKKIHRTSTAF